MSSGMKFPSEPLPPYEPDYESDDEDYCESCGEHFDVCLCCPYCGAGMDEDCDILCPRPIPNSSNA